MIVYVDVVFGFNFVMNYLILNCVRKISGVKTRKGGCVYGAAAGGIYSVFMFEPMLTALYSIGGKLLFSMLIILFCFRVRNNFIKLLFYFYITAFAFSGVCEFASNFFGVIQMKNGLIYSQNSIWILMAVCIIAASIISYVIRHMKISKKRYGEIISVTITLEGKSVTVKGMYDTGNSLLDPITLFPVTVVEFDSIKSILPEEIKEFLKEGSDLSCNINRRYLGRIRLVPYNSVGANDILKGFRPDMIKLENSENEIKDVVVAVIYNKLSKSDQFEAIVNPLIQEGI